MSRSSYLFSGIFGSFALSCFALVLVPQAQIGGVQPQTDEETGTSYPIDNARSGQQVYAAQGCFYCHTQQIRDSQNGTDIDRGWGVRRTVARDYLFEKTPFLGSTRIGPDLANVGSKDWRNEPKDDSQKPARRNEKWHLHHLYSPRSIVRESNMPPFRYLFDKRKISGQRSVDALDLTGEDTPPAGYEIVPKPEAKALVAYLLSLDRSHPLAEAKQTGVEAASAASAPATK